MRKYLLLGALVGIVFLSGCAMIGYNDKTGDINYFRAGPQSLKDVYLKAPNGLELRIGEQKADPTELLLKGIEIGTKLLK